MTQDFYEAEWLRLKKLLLSLRSLDQEKAQAIVSNLPRDEVARLLLAYATTQQPEEALKSIEMVYKVFPGEPFIHAVKLIPREELTRLCRARPIGSLPSQAVERLIGELSLPELQVLALCWFMPADDLRALSFFRLLSTDRCDDIFKKLRARGQA